MQFLRPQGKYVARSYIAWIVANLLDLAIPIQIAWAIDGGITAGNQQVLTVAVLTAMGLYMAKPGINWIYVWGFHAYEADALGPCAAASTGACSASPSATSTARTRGS